VPGARAAQGARPAAHRRDPRPGRDPGAEPAGAGRRDLRAALNELATPAPDWLRAAAPEVWYRRYARRVEDHRLPRAEAEREAYARAVGEDGFALLARLDEPGAAEGLRRLPRVEALRQVWARHFVREPAGPPAGGGGVRLRGKADPSAPAVVSPYDPEARYRGRHATVWTGYVVHLSETATTTRST
jgi:transposase